MKHRTDAMGNILEMLAAHAEERVRTAKQTCSLAEMKARAETYSDRRGSIPSLEEVLSGPEPGFICECKKASPSKGLIAPDFPYLAIAKEYEEAGAAAISVLTEPKWFLGRNEYLAEIAREVRIPCLRKDFVVDEYMIYEAKTLGASAVLLICAILDKETLEKYIRICDSIGLSALVEAHDEAEVAMAAAAGARIIGVNNRNLKDFTVDIRNSIRLRKAAPEGILFVAESGIRNAAQVGELRRNGVNGILVGETLMRAADKRAALDELRLPEKSVRGNDSERLRFKICGLRREEDVKAVNEAKPDMAGFIFDPARRRYIAPEKAAELTRRLDPAIQPVGVFVNAAEDTVLRTMEICPLACIQLHGRESNEYIRSLRKRISERHAAGNSPDRITIIKAFRIESPKDLEDAEKSEADLVLLDHGIGGTGKSFDWTMLKDFKRKYILAGGIGAENLAEAVKCAAPYAVDASSSLETDGVKDAARIREFADAVRRVSCSAKDD